MNPLNCVPSWVCRFGQDDLYPLWKSNQTKQLVNQALSLCRKQKEKKEHSVWSLPPVTWSQVARGSNGPGFKDASVETTWSNVLFKCGLGNTCQERCSTRNGFYGQVGFGNMFPCRIFFKKKKKQLFLIKNLLNYSWFTMPQVYNKVIQFYIYSWINIFTDVLYHIFSIIVY